MTRYFGLNGLDQKLETYIGYNNGYFVELGANNGVDQSNTLYYELNRGWQGVLIEPTPHNYLKCRQNRSKRNFVTCAACVPFDYQDEFVKIAYSNLMSSPMGLDSDVKDPVAHADWGRKHIANYEEVFVFGALARTLNSILLQAEAPSTIDLLSLDVEGAELAVLKGIDHDKFRFKYICIECRDLSRIANFMIRNGYYLVEKLTLHDYLFASKYS